MPRADRLRAAVGLVDAELADWAESRGIKVSAGQIRRWRLAGLIPAPSVPRPRPPGAPPGRAALAYTDVDFQIARRGIEFLAAHARRGRPSTDLALLMFAADLPVKHDVVVAGLRDQIGRACGELESFVTAASEGHGDVGPEMTLSETYERAEAAADRAVSKRSGLTRWIRRHLREARQPAQDEDVRSVLTGIFRMFLGESPPVEDAVMLDQILYAVGGHGLVETAFPGAPVVVPEGVAGFGASLDLATRAGFQVPDDVSYVELASVRDRCRSLALALASIPDKTPLRYYLGGEAVDFWQPEDPLKVALLLTYFVNVSRIASLDPAPIIAAVQRQGWLQASERHR